MSGQTVAVIPARGGSKGILRKNLIDFCGKPLLAWSIQQAKAAKSVDSVWVSSDDAEILAIGETFGAKPILRPAVLSGDTASSEDAWLHAIDCIQNQGNIISCVVAMQATSPLREASDLDKALEVFATQKLASLFSASELEDFFIWRKQASGALESLNYDYLNRKRRQDLGDKQYVENGSFYLFTPQAIASSKNRLSGKIGICEMAFWKAFEINSPADVKLCEAIMKAFLL